MSWIDALTALIGSLNPILSVGIPAATAVVGYFVNQWLNTKAQQKAAADQMTQDMTAHASDGTQSVNDAKSAEDQLTKLKQELDQMDQQQGGKT